MYEVVKPTGKSAVKEFQPAAPLEGLEGKKVGLFWTIFTNGDKLADVLEEELVLRFAGIEIVKLPGGKNVKWGDYPDESIIEVVEEVGIDAGIVLVGG